MPVILPFANDAFQLHSKYWTDVASIVTGGVALDGLCYEVP